MKSKDLLARNDSDLNKQLNELTEKATKLAMDVQLKKQKNHNLIKATKTDIARIMTVLRERQLLAEAQPKPESKSEESTK